VVPCMPAAAPSGWTCLAACLAVDQASGHMHHLLTAVSQAWVLAQAEPQGTHHGPVKQQNVGVGSGVIQGTCDM
jgi:hypothetical protein